MTDDGTKTAKHAKEGGHWYDADGRQVVEVTGAKGQPVKPTLRHARKLDLVPGVTTVIGQVKSYQLERWKIRQAVLAALTLPRVDGETDAAYLNRIDDDGREQAKAAAERGTAIHAAIQGYADTNTVGVEWLPWIEGVTAELHAAGIATSEPWRSEVACVSTHGYGTKADLVVDGWLLDFKTKDAVDGKTKPYDEHAQQLAATRVALRESTDLVADRCGIVFLTRDEPVTVRLVEIDEAEICRGWDCFAALLWHWQAKHRHHPWQGTTP